MTNGSIGTINAEFTASTSNFSAAVKAVGESLAATATKATAAGEKTAGVFATMHRLAGESVQDYHRRAIAAQQTANMVSESAQKTIASLQGMTTASERLRRERQRQQVMYGRQADSEAELARMQEEAALKADILTRANEKLAMTADSVGSHFQLMSVEVRESMAAMGEKISTVAEKAEISADGIASGFGALGSILGLGIFGEMIGHFIDDTAEFTVKIGDVAKTTKIAGQTIAGLQAVAQGMGQTFQPIIKGLQRMSTAQMEAAIEWHDASSLQVQAFKHLGISMQEVQHDTPEEMFFRLSRALHDNTDATFANAAAREIFGRGSTNLLPIFDKYGAELEETSRKLGDESGYTDQAYESSEQWLQLMREISLELHSIAIPALEYLVPVLKDIGVAFDLALKPIIMEMEELLTEYTTLARVIEDSSHLNFSGMLQDAKLGLATLKLEINDNWKDIKEDVNTFSLSPSSVSPSETGKTDLSGMAPHPKQMAMLEDQYRQFTAYHKRSNAELIAFWKHRQEYTAQGGAEWIAIQEKIGKLQQKSDGLGSGASKAVSRADHGQRDAWKLQLDALKQNHTLTLAEEADFWSKRVSEARKGNAILAQTQLAAVGQRAREFLTREQQKVSSGIKPDDAAGKKALEDQLRQMRSRDLAMLAGIRQQESLTITSARLYGATGAISKYDQAQVIATAHTQAYREEMELLQAQMERLANLPNREADRAELQEKMDTLQSARPEQEIQDQATLAAQTVSGALTDAMGQFVQQAQDTAAMVKEIFASTLGGVNRTLSNALMMHANNSQERMRNLSNGFSETFRGAGSTLLNNSFSRAESSVMGRFGVSAGKKPTLAAGDAGHVIVDNLPGGVIPGLSHMTPPAAMVPELQQRSEMLTSASTLARSFPSSIDTSKTNAIIQAAPNFNLAQFGIPQPQTSEPSSPQALPSAFSWMPAYVPPTVLGPSGDSDDLGGGQTQAASSSTYKPRSGGWGNTVQSLVKFALPMIPGMASGGPVSPDMTYMIGEQGPELFTPSARGNITPNHLLSPMGSGSGGDSHTWNIDARGSNDPAQTIAIIDRYMRSAGPNIAAAAVRSMHETKMRSPSSTR